MAIKSDLPFGSEFSPSQISLVQVLELARAHDGHWRAFEDAVKSAYFASNATSDYNKGIWQRRGGRLTAKKRPSGHDISEKFSIDNGAAIPPNLIAIPNTESNSYYLRYCQEHGLKAHPARYPAELPEYFVRMLTDRGDLVIDPFAGSCVTGEVCERLDRRWLCIELVEDYLQGALGRFQREPTASGKPPSDPQDQANYYRVPHPGILWNGPDRNWLPQDGGRRRKIGNRQIPQQRSIARSFRA